MAKKTDWPPAMFTKRWFDLEQVKMLQMRLQLISGLELQGLTELVRAEIERRDMTRETGT